jgi:hypothetical protein
MDDIEICPPWWPLQIWWLIEYLRKHPPGDPPPRPEWEKLANDLFISVATLTESFTYPAEARAELQRIAADQLQSSAAALSKAVIG